jgi:hypothetical protein
MITWQGNFSREIKSETNSTDFGEIVSDVTGNINKNN